MNRARKYDAELESIEIQLLIEGVRRHSGVDLEEYSGTALRRRIWGAVKTEKTRTISGLLEKLLHEGEIFQRFLDGLVTSEPVPAARVPTSTMSLGYIWIESGYTWLLWSGGIPLLFAFLWFLWVGLRRHLRLARRADVVGVAATAVVVTLILVGVLMAIDPHLTYRGAADLLFALLGLVAALRHADEGDVRRPHPTDVRNLRHRRVVSPSWRPS